MIIHAKRQNMNTSTENNNASGPISGVCVVADYTRVPNGYVVIRKTYDDPTRDADLHRDGLFRRIDRYMCVTRYPFEKIVEDVILINCNENPPSSYKAITTTIDTNENATSKKTICVRMSPKATLNKAVNDIIFLSRQKRPPPGYSLVGEINGLLLCYSEWIANAPVRRAPPPPVFSFTRNENSLYPSAKLDLETSFDIMTIPRDDYGWQLVSSIPFKLSAALKNSNKKKATDDCWKLPPLTPIDIETKYFFDFKLEKAWIID